ncbi:hypothetical protein Gasu2_04720 [Galdieria sulphuraria]|nr:hypothetical protein Gasu2_04720 [Galdieria sulphuraria]
MNCLRDNAVAADRKIPHDLFSCFLRTNQTCATIHSQRESHPIPSFVAQSVLEESQSQSKFEKDSNSLLSESHQYGEELTREYKIKRNDWTSVRRSLYKEFVQPVGQQLSVGTLLGLATGYSLRRIGRFALFLIGTEVLVLQLMAYKGWVTIHWNKLSRDIIPVLDKSAAESIMDILLYKMPFTAAFCAGLRLAP